MTVPTTSIDDLFDRVKSHIARNRTQVAAPAPRARQGHFSQVVYDRIDEAAILADATTVEPFLTPARTPIVGSALQRVRLAAHNLVVFYVNRHAGAQITFNREVAAGLREVVEALDEDEWMASAVEVVALRQEVKALQERMARLEQALAGATGGAE